MTNDDFDLNKETVAALIEKVQDQELRDALRVVARHLASHPTLDRNEATWGLFDDTDTDYGLIFGVYRH
jgi:hypothetical protein